MLSNGIVYVAFGRSYIEEAIDASRSLRIFNPELPICLISDSKTKHPEFDFNIYAERPEPVIRGKLEMFNSPFQKTLFLDTDTEVFASLREIFELLDRFDIVFQQDSSGYHYKLEGVPHAFPEPSTGVIGFAKSDRLAEFSKLWGTYFDRYVTEMGREWDQRSFRHAIYASNLRFSVLPPEYNFLIYFPQYAMSDLKIIHGRPGSRRAEVKQLMDRKLGPRVHAPRFGCIGFYNQMTLGSIATLIVNAMGVFILECAKRTTRRLGLYSWAQTTYALLRNHRE